MKIYYKNILKLLITILLVLVFVTLAKLFGYNFELNVTLFSLIFLLLTLIYVILESIKNREQIQIIIKKRLKKEKNNVNSKKIYIISKTVDLLPILDNRTGRFFISIFSDFLLLFSGLFMILRKTIFSKYLLFALCVFGIIFEIFIITEISEWFVYLLTCLWVVAIILFKFKSKITIIGALIFMTMTPILLIMNNEITAEKFANWAYMFLLVGVIQLVIENRKTEIRDEILDTGNKILDM